MSGIEVKQAVPSESRNASGSAPAGKGGSSILTAFSATGTAPTLDVVIEVSSEIGIWREVARFRQMGGAGQDARRLSGEAEYPAPVARYRWTISAGASFTFGIQEHR